MQMATLNSGDKIPMIGLGTWQSTPEELKRVVEFALATGYRHIDCASIYLNQQAIGQAFSRIFARGNITRQQLWVTSKLWNSFHRPEDVAPALKRSLSDLQLDYLDLFLMHWPLAFKKHLGLNDPESYADFESMDDVRLEDTWHAMHACQQQGLVRNIGVSNFSVSKLQRIIDSTRIVPAMNQVECHPFLAQFTLQDYCQQHGIVLTGYSPLGSGGRPDFAKRTDEPVLLSHPVVTSIAQSHAKTPAQILIAWLLARGIVAIPKSSHEQRLQQNLAADQLQLNLADIAALNQLDCGHRYVDARFWEATDRPFEASQLWA